MQIYAIRFLLVPLIITVVSADKSLFRGNGNQLEYCDYREYYLPQYSGNTKACEFELVKYYDLSKPDARKCCSEQGCCRCYDQPTLKSANACNPKNDNQGCDFWNYLLNNFGPNPTTDDVATCKDELESYYGFDARTTKACCTEEGCCICFGSSVIRKYLSCDPPPPTPPPPPPPPPECFDEGVQACPSIDNCFLSHSEFPDSNYTDDYQCSITLTQTGTLTVDTFDLEEGGYDCPFDFLALQDGTKFCGVDPDGLNGTAVTAGDRLCFRTDGSVVFAGFKVCVVDE